MQEEQQKFQSRGQLFALQVHAAWEVLEHYVLYPFRWLSDQFGQTEGFREKEAQLRLVK